MPKEQNKVEDTKEIETLKIQIKDNKWYSDVFQRSLKHIVYNGYVDFIRNKNDRKLFGMYLIIFTKI